MNAIKELLNKIWLNKKDVSAKYVGETEEIRGYTFRSLDVSAIESVLPQLQDEASKLDMTVRFGKGQLEYGNGCDFFNNKPIRKSYLYVGKDTREEQSVDVLDALA
tara:strand:+ start:130 stop:447 length:318 start_codon:yes stop_codon:yes gene_type:complete